MFPLIVNIKLLCRRRIKKELERKVQILLTFSSYLIIWSFAKWRECKCQIVDFDQMYKNYGTQLTYFWTTKGVGEGGFRCFIPSRTRQCMETKKTEKHRACPEPGEAGQHAAWRQLWWQVFLYHIQLWALTTEMHFTNFIVLSKLKLEVGSREGQVGGKIGRNCYTKNSRHFKYWRG